MFKTSRGNYPDVVGPYFRSLWKLPRRFLKRPGRGAGAQRAKMVPRRFAARMWQAPRGHSDPSRCHAVATAAHQMPLPASLARELASLEHSFQQSPSVYLGSNFRHGVVLLSFINFIYIILSYIIIKL